jgi:hypothetical protein
VKRYFIIAFVFVAALIAGALGFLGRHFNDVPRAVDAWLREAWYKLQNEPIDPEQAVTQVAESAVPIRVRCRVPSPIAHRAVAARTTKGPG